MIITSRLDNDFYQFTMGQVIWKLWKDYKVSYEFRNRTFAVPLASALPVIEVQAQLDAVRSLKFTSQEINYLRGTDLFQEEYLLWLREDHILPAINVEANNSHLVIETDPDASWADAVFWETHILSVVSELYYRRFEALDVEGIRRLRSKAEYLKEYPNMKFVEFGTRRRYSRSWQESVLNYLVEQCKHQLVGTSNVALAYGYDLPAVGTMAHQLFMVMTAKAKADPQNAKNNPLAIGNAQVADGWGSVYGEKLRVYLPDTYGTTWTLRQAEKAFEDGLSDWHMRQDSGDPFEIGELILAHWQSYGVNPKDRQLIFSDGLDLRTMSLLWDRFAERTRVVFGWGTNLTNDLGFESLSLVVKPKSVDGIPCVKLSDNPAKATGPAEEIAKYKQLAGYKGTAQETRY